jgi:hypothetical protein
VWGYYTRNCQALLNFSCKLSMNFMSPPNMLKAKYLAGAKKHRQECLCYRPGRVAHMLREFRHTRLSPRSQVLTCFSPRYLGASASPQ